MTDDLARKLEAFLARQDERADLAVTEFRELVAGWSRQTYLAAIRRAPDAALQRVVVQVEKAGGVIADSSMARDVQVLRVLSAAGLPVARPLWASDDASILGGPFMVAQLLPGRSFDMSDAAQRETLRSHAQRDSGLGAAIVDALAAVHSTPVEHLPFLPSAELGRATAQYEIDRCRRLAQLARVEHEPVVALAFHWLERHRPASGTLALVHGDFHMRNLLIDGERVTGIVDWEVTRISEPLFDLAYMSIPYLGGKFFTPGAELVAGVLPQDRLLAEYQGRTGRRIGEADFHFWRVLATLSLLLVVSKGVSDFEAGTLTSARNAWARFSEPVLHEDILNLLTMPAARHAGA
ncbi:phosphotransferase family protein [Ramlibacter sp.]|uniref:phosphotransferase family protein n=1 Tax=Ramlibacter sp. TaxID=1917967 RepID=UPI003D0F27C5